MAALFPLHVGTGPPKCVSHFRVSSVVRLSNVGSNCYNYDAPQRSPASHIRCTTGVSTWLRVVGSASASLVHHRLGC